MGWQVWGMRVEESVIFVVILARLLRLPQPDRCMKYGFKEWAVRWTEIQLNICAQSFVKSGMIFKKRKFQPQPPVQTGGARSQLTKYLMGRNPAGARLFSVVPADKADASGHKIKLLRFLVDAKSGLYCEDKQRDRFPGEAVWSLHPWRYLKPSPGHGPDVALGKGLGKALCGVASLSLWVCDMDFR